FMCSSLYNTTTTCYATMRAARYCSCSHSSRVICICFCCSSAACIFYIYGKRFICRRRQAHGISAYLVGVGALYFCIAAYGGLLHIVHSAFVHVHLAVYPFQHLSEQFAIFLHPAIEHYLAIL